MPLLPYLDGGVPDRPRGVPSLPVGQGAQAFAQALQDVSQATQRIFEANQRSQVRRALADSAVELGAAQDETIASGDFQGAEEKFSKAIEAQRARSKGLKGIYADEFALQLDTLGAGETLRLRGWAREEAARGVRANIDASTQSWVSRFADTGETSYFDQALRDLDGALADHALTPEQHQTAREGLYRQAASDRAAVMIRKDPEAAMLTLQTDPFFDNISEAQRGSLLSAAEQQARVQANARASRDKDALEAAGHEAYKGFVDKAVAGTWTLADAQRVRDVVSDDDYKEMVNVAANGGRLKPPEGAGRDPATYSTLYDLAESGDPSASARIRMETATGGITPEQHNTLLRLSDTKRFQTARDLIKSAFPRDTVFNMEAKTVTFRDDERAASARAAFEDWVRTKGSDASVDEARKQAQLIINDYRESARGQMGEVLPKPHAAPSKPTTWEHVQAADAATWAAFSAAYGGGKTTADTEWRVLEAILRDPEFQDQVRILNQWRALLPRPAKTTGAPK